MRDKTDEQITAERIRAVFECGKLFPDEEIEIADSFFEGAPHDAKPLWFLGKSFQILSTCDAAYFCNGWSDYRGCKMEHDAALAYGIQTIDEDPFEQK